MTVIMLLLQTERLILRNFQIDDWQALREMIAQYEASGLAAYDHPWPTAPDEIQRAVEWFASGDSYLAVCLSESDHFIGFVALNRESDSSPDYALGYVFNLHYHGQGYATEACRAVIAHAFRDLNAPRLVAGTAAVNHASCRLLERLRFREISEAPASFRNAPNGEPLTFAGCMYALSREDWSEKR